MNPETFFEKFDELADAPDGVAKMRELVLQLAVQGRLISQISTDESGDTLAASIAQDRAAFVKERGLARQRVFASVEEDQCPFPLPSGWHWTRLGNLCRVQAGFAFQSAAFVQGDSGVPMIRIRDITKDRTQVNYVGEYREEFLVAAGDYLVGMDGNFTVARWRGPRALLNQRVSRLQWYSRRLEPSFFAVALQHRLSELQGTKAYTTVDHLSSAQIEDAVVPLPPLAEQKRIVTKVDGLMALCDRLEALQQERETRHAALARASLARLADAPTPTNLEYLFHPSYAIPPGALRKSILTLAVQGKLVPQDPSDTTASEMLASDAQLPDGHVRRRKIMKRAPLASRAEMLPGLPPSWVYADVQTLYDLNIIVDYADGNHGSLYPRSSEFGDSGVRFVTARDIANGRVSWEGCARLNEERANQLTKGWARGGDVLLTHNATVGRVAKVEREIGRFLLGTSATFYRLNEQFIDPSYFYYVLCSPTWQSQLEAIMEQTTRHQVSIQKQAYFQVPIAPLAEQRRIVARVEQLMTLVDALETQLAASRTIGASLAEAVVGALTARS